MDEDTEKMALESIRKLEELEKSKEGEGGSTDKCWIAMKAAWDTLAEYCGGTGVTMDLMDVTLTVPIDVIETARTHPDMSHDERVEIVAQTEWCRSTAMNMCENLFGAESGTATHRECIDSVAKRIALKIVS